MDATTPEEARDAIGAALLRWRAEGVDQPIVPVFSQEDSTGTPEFYGLSWNGEPEAVPAEQVFRTDEGHWERQ